VPGNDFDEMICDTVDGVIVETYEEALTMLRHLLDCPGEAYEIGKRGRKRARELFGKERFVRDWMEYLGELGVA